LFLALAQKYQMNTGHAAGIGIIPIIIGRSLDSARLANHLLHAGINVQPIIYPAVNESSARLRFFISALHTEEQILHTIDVLHRYLT
jgi:8-amino-7-oxononanoate synthase